MEVVDTSFAAMGTTARLYLWHPPAGLMAELRDRLAELESRWSRFLDDSETTAVNSRAGEPVQVGPDTMLLVSRALTASRLTRGWFDPTLLVELAEHGYDRTFSELSPARADKLVVTLDRSSRGGVHLHEWQALSSNVELDRRAGTVTVPVGTGFDPGGLGKGLAADLLVTQAIEAGASATLVDLGGDIATAGLRPNGGWPIEVENPFDRAGTVTTLRLPWGAVATSSRSRRRWVHNGEDKHHLFDPRTRSPSTSNVASATVIAGACWLAEAYAKAALLAGTDHGLDLLMAGGVEGLIIDSEQNHHMTGAMARFLS